MHSTHLPSSADDRDDRAVVGGHHVQIGTNRRLTYSAWFALVESRLYIRAWVHAGDRTLASPELEGDYLPGMGPVQDVVVAELIAFIDETTFGVGAATARH